MNTITDLFQQAQLAEAAYASFFNNTGGLIATSDELKTALIANKFSDAQATAFVARYQVVSQYTAPGTIGMDGGFSATLFLDTTTGGFERGQVRIKF